MTPHDYASKLQALSGSVARALETPGVRYFFRARVVDLFERYNRIRDQLRKEFPERFDDLPIRPDTGFGGEHVPRLWVEMLQQDIEYCLHLLSTIPVTDQVPSIRVAREGVFFAGQFFDAIQWIADLVRAATRAIVLVDGYFGPTGLKILTAKGGAVTSRVLMKSNAVSPSLVQEATAFAKQYGGIEIRTSEAFHDRFILIDDADLYHLGASVEHLGGRGFMFSRVEEPEVVAAVKKKIADEWIAGKRLV